MRKLLQMLVAGAAVLGVSAPVLATTHEAPKAQTLALADGEVRRVDKNAKRLTLRHGPIANLDMPPMTMVFHVKDPGMVEQVKVGDKVRFSAEKVGGAYTVTTLEPVK